MKIALLFICLTCGAFAIAQPVHKNTTPFFTSINSIGVLTGSSSDNFTVQTINGVAYKNWNVGIGTGIDWYGVRTIPLVLDVRRYFTQHKSKPFVYANGGLSFPWAKDRPVEWNTTKTAYRKSPCAELGLGYTLATKNAFSMFISAGYSYKHVRYNQYYFLSDPVAEMFELKNTYDFNYRRIALRLGISF